MSEQAVMRPARRAWWRDPATQLLIAMAAGVVLGLLAPRVATQMRVLGDLFIRLISMFVGLIIFCTVVHGVAAGRNAGRIGRVAVTALIYFEVITTFALVLALLLANVTAPGGGMHIDPASLSMKAVATYARDARQVNLESFLLGLVPKTALGALADGEILQILVFATIFAFGLLSLGERGAPLTALIETVSQTLFRVIGWVMKLAPIGAFGAIAYTVGAYGPSVLLSLGRLVLEFYVCCLLFVVVVLGPVALWQRVPLWKLIRYLGAELLIVFGTSSGESVFPRVVDKLRALGCEEGVVGLVLPLGYSFNHDGTCLYFATVAVFLAQALGIDMTIWQQVTLVGILLFTSKGGAGVAGSALVVLASTVAATGFIPLASVGLILGVHRILSSAFVPVNVLGNALATLVVARREGVLDRERMLAVLAEA
jgi:aerobic C4-dicarboxylate transport protein